MQAQEPVRGWAWAQCWVGRAEPASLCCCLPCLASQLCGRHNSEAGDRRWRLSRPGGGRAWVERLWLTPDPMKWAGNKLVTHKPRDKHSGRWEQSLPQLSEGISAQWELWAGGGRCWGCLHQSLTSRHQHHPKVNANLRSWLFLGREILKASVVNGRKCYNTSNSPAFLTPSLSLRSVSFLCPSIPCRDETISLLNYL